MTLRSIEWEMRSDLFFFESLLHVSIVPFHAHARTYRISLDLSLSLPHTYTQHASLPSPSISRPLSFSPPPPSLARELSISLPSFLPPPLPSPLHLSLSLACSHSFISYLIKYAGSRPIHGRRCLVRCQSFKGTRFQSLRTRLVRWRRIRVFQVCFRSPPCKPGC